MNTLLPVSIVVETYNLVEGTDRARFAAALGAAAAAAGQRGGEVLVTDVCGGPDVAGIVAAAAPEARLLDAVGLSYDEAKMLAAVESRGESIVYLDSDCEPVGDWPETLLETLRRYPLHAGVGGLTRYQGEGLVAAVMSVMDFGFLIPVEERPLACYAFNNAAFHRSALLACPSASGGLRCGCFAHAQALLRQGTPMILAPRAVARHDLPPMVRERSRQGHDTIAACWENADLPEARFLWLGVFSVPLFYGMRVALDWKRLAVGYRHLGLGPLGLVGALALVVPMRLLDAMGMIHAFVVGRRAESWGGF